MQKIRIVSVGKLKEKHFVAAQAEYCKMLGRFAKVEIVELRDEPAPPSLSPAEEEAVRRAEGERVLRAAEGFDFVAALAIEGVERDSEGFAAALRPQMDAGKSMCFLIGGSLGLWDGVKRRADALLSLSRMTFPHRIARILLLEQLFRAYKICAGELYHK